MPGPVAQFLFGSGGGQSAPSGAPSTSRELEQRIEALEQSSASQGDMLSRHHKDLDRVFIELPAKAQAIQVDAVDGRTATAQTDVLRLEDGFDGRAQENVSAWAESNFGPNATAWFKDELDQAEFNVRADGWALGRDFGLGNRIVAALGLDDDVSASESVTTQTVGAVAKMLSAIGNDLPAPVGTAFGGGGVGGGGFAGGAMGLGTGGDTPGLGALPGAKQLEEKLRFLLQTRGTDREGAFGSISALHFRWDSYRVPLDLLKGTTNLNILKDMLGNWAAIKSTSSDFINGKLSAGMSASIKAIIDARVAKLNAALAGAGLNAVQLGAMASLTEDVSPGVKVHSRLKLVVAWYTDWWESGALSGLGMNQGIFDGLSDKWWAVMTDRKDGAVSRFDNAVDDWWAHRPNLFEDGFLAAMTSLKDELFARIKEWTDGQAWLQDLKDRVGEVGPMSDGLDKVRSRFGEMKTQMEEMRDCHKSMREQMKDLLVSSTNDRDFLKKQQAQWTMAEIIAAIVSPVLGLVIAAGKAMPSAGDGERVMGLISGLAERQTRLAGFMDRGFGCLELAGGNMGSLFGGASENLKPLTLARS